MQLRVEAFKLGRGWGWHYTAGPMNGQTRGALLLTAEAALTQGMNAARARVDMP